MVVCISKLFEIVGWILVRQTGGGAGSGDPAELEEVEPGREGKEVKGREGGFGG